MVEFSQKILHHFVAVFDMFSGSLKQNSAQIVYKKDMMGELFVQHLHH